MAERRAVVGGVGVAATLVGVLAVVQPALVAGTEPFASLVALLSDGPVRAALLAVVVLVGLSVVWGTDRLYGESDADTEDREAADRFEDVLETPPERVTADETAATGRSFDAAVDRAVAGDDSALERVRERLADVAVARLVRYAGHTPESAERAVATGAWTRDYDAAAFLAGPNGPGPARRARLRHWLDPETERRRRLTRTLDAVAALDGRSPPPPTAGNTAPAGTDGARGGTAGREVR